MRKLTKIFRIFRKGLLYLLIPVVLVAAIYFYIHQLTHTDYANDEEIARAEEQRLTDERNEDEIRQLSEPVKTFGETIQEDLTQDTALEDIAKPEEEKPEELIEPQTSEPCKFTILDVGQASAFIAESNGEYMIFDGGDRDTSSFVVAYCKQHGIKRIKYMVASHYHADHVYGLIGILESGIAVDRVICPDYVSDAYAQSDFLSRVPDDIRVTPYPGQTLLIGEITARCICPVTDEYSDDNGYSVGFVLSYGGTKLLIDGDATSESEQDMLDEGIDVDADILIVPHHGSTYSSSEEWLKAVSPDIAIISCGKDNEYFHPHGAVLDRLKACGVLNLYRTDLNGTIEIFSDGEGFEIRKERTVTSEELWKPGEGDPSTVQSDSEKEAYYIANVFSKKFHRPDCKNVPSEDRQKLFTERNKALSEGYSPCGVCRP